MRQIPAAACVARFWAQPPKYCNHYYGKRSEPERTPGTDDDPQQLGSPRERILREAIHDEGVGGIIGGLVAQVALLDQDPTGLHWAP